MAGLAPEPAVDAEFMQQAIREARRAENQDEVPVGAVVVVGGAIVARGYNRNIADHDPAAHAEMVALREAGRRLGNHRLPGATLYVTLEPCVMCAGAMIHARIDRLVFGASDPKSGAAGGKFDLLNMPGHNHQVAVTQGVCADECGEMLRTFFRSRR